MTVRWEGIDDLGDMVLDLDTGHVIYSPVHEGWGDEEIQEALAGGRIDDSEPTYFHFQVWGADPTRIIEQVGNSSFQDLSCKKKRPPVKLHHQLNLRMLIPTSRCSRVPSRRLQSPRPSERIFHRDWPAVTISPQLMGNRKKNRPII